MVKISSLKTFFAKCRRVWFALKKPSKEEYQIIAKVSAIGVAILGLFGFFIAWLMNLFK